MISEEHIINFDKLDINTKRNQISNELMIIGELIKENEKKHGYDSKLSIKNYDQVNDKDLSEAEMLTFMYEDIFNIQQELIIALSLIDNK